METFSALLALCAGNSPFPCEFPAQRPVTWSFDVFCDLRLNKRLSKQSWGWWFETLSWSLWRHCDDIVTPLKVIWRSGTCRFNQRVRDWLLHGIKVPHDNVIKWKHFPRYWPFVLRGIHRSPVNSPQKGQWRAALMFSLICTWINVWVNKFEASDLRHHRADYDVSVMQTQYSFWVVWNWSWENTHPTK